MNAFLYNMTMTGRLLFKRGPAFYRSLEELMRYTELDALQRRVEQLRLLGLTLHAARRAPHYAASLSRIAQVDTPIELLKALPYLAKETVRSEPGAFLTGLHPRFAAHTSGTTGTPIELKRSLHCIAREEAGMTAWYRSAGWSPDDMLLVLRGDLVIPAGQSGPPYAVRDRVFNRLVFSSYHMADRTLHWYIEQMRASGARFLSAYPSAAHVLAEFMQRTGREPLALKAVFLASETVHETHAELIARYLGPVHAHYGNAERVAWMTTCSAGRYHEDTSYGLTEYVPAGDGLHEIVATGFVNDAMPLLRYRTGDMAVEPFTWEQFCPCGRPGPGCRQIVGRIDDLVVTLDGRRIGRLDHVFKGVRHVVAAQIVQHAPDRIEVRVVPGQSFAAADEQAIAANLAARVGPAMHIGITRVPAIPRTHAGKFRAVAGLAAQRAQNEETDARS